MSDPRRASRDGGQDGHAAPAYRQPTQEQDVSWLDFLRSAGGSVAADQRSTSAERKRRYTGSNDPARRPYPYLASAESSSQTVMNVAPTTNAEGTSQPSGASLDTAIDLASPSQERQPAPTRHVSAMVTESRGSSASTRRSSDIVLPKWQPDSEVTRCPVCNTEFSFWYRKHHCRKCGRVVCAACSPHRITIPRQYIVQPPNVYEDSGLFGPPFLEPESPERRALGGGEVVRVCNPCVPDPWTPDAGSSRGPENVGEQARASSEAAQHSRTVTTTGHDANRFPSRLPPPYVVVRNRSQSHEPRPTPFGRSIPSSGVQPGGATTTSTSVNRFAAGTNPQFPPSTATLVAMGSSQPRASNHRHAYSQSQLYQASNSSSTLSPALSGTHRPAMAPSTPSAPPHTQPRRMIREEDECPVCGRELPPGEQIREQHIESCIAERTMGHFTPTSSSLHHRHSASPSTTPGPASTSTGRTSTPPASASSVPSRPRATSYHMRGMFVYTATEKDCADEEGRPQECIICLEEFEPGEELGRMECLCKFHRKCLRQWWDRKGGGNCPTHTLQDE